MNSLKKLLLVSPLILAATLSPSYAQMSNDSMNPNGTNLPTTDAIRTTATNPKATTNATKATSAEIASMGTIAAIDKSEILLSVIAAHKDATSSIANYAKMMIDMHGSNLTQILEMAHQNNVKPSMNATMEKIKNESMQEMMTLGGLKGKEFDKAYIDTMVKGHEAALNLIDTKLMKTAKAEEVKKFLTDTRTVVEQHLADAKKIQAELKA
jgi:putative membrane protein